MPDQLEYVVKDAIMLCDKGAAPGFFKPTHNAKVKINKCLVTTTADKEPIVNIPTFKVCAVNQAPCKPQPTFWQDPYNVKVKGEKTLLFRCSMECGAGGKIEFATSGQVPIPPEDMDELLDEFGEEPSWWDKTKDMVSSVANELSWWDAAEMIPFVGGVIGMVRSAMDNPTDWLGIGLSAFSVVADVAGLFSFGAGNAVSAWAKGLKVTSKAAKVAKAAKASKVASKALKLTAKTGKAFGKALGKKVDDIAKKYGKVCVFACFPAGTPISTKDGHKNIEDIEVDDLVWAYNEDTGQIGLKRVVELIENEIDATIKIQIEDEIIETTAEHPFYTKEGWKKAADLTEKDSIKNKAGEWLKINKSFFEYNKKNVYNFEVEDWHTFFVSTGFFLVHNGKKCENNIKKLLDDEGLVGTFKELINRGKKGDNLTPHHMPSDKYMSKKGVSRNDGVSMNMEMPSPGKGGRHRKTKTYGGNMTKQEKAEYFDLSPRDALARDIADVRRIYKEEGLYTKEIKEGLLELISKNKEKFPELFKK